MAAMALTGIGPKRKLVQALSVFLLLGLPFIRVKGDSLLRMDAASRTLLFFGAHIRIEEFYLFLLACLILVFGFLFVTMVFGRVWCGWLCPQTTVTDLVEFIDRKLQAVCSVPFIAVLLKHVWHLLLSFTIAANLIWFFIPPAEFFRRLATGELGMVAGITLIAVILLLQVDTVLIRRSFCTSVCPYGRIQLMCMDRNTLTLEFDPALKDKCLRCGACIRACPTGIDIRVGLQVECINCGRCLDACRDVTAHAGRDRRLIHYTFGTVAEGGGRPLTVRTALLGAVILACCTLLAVAIATRTGATLKVQRGAEGEIRRLSGGEVINFFSAYIENRASEPGTFALSVSPITGYRMELLGPVRTIDLAPNQNRRVDFALKVMPVPAVPLEAQLLLLREGDIIATTPVMLLSR